MTDRLRILHLGNGRAFKVKVIADEFVRRGHDVHMVPLPPTPEPWEGMAWHHLPEPSVPGPAKVLARMMQVRRLAARLQPDIVHAHYAWGPGWYGAFTGRHPYFIHGFGGDLLPDQFAGRAGWQRRLTTWACRTADRVVVTGAHMIDASSRGLDVPKDRYMLLPSGVDLRLYRPGLDTSALRAQLGLGDAAPVIFSPRYQVDEPLYNLDQVIEGFAAFRAQVPDAVCLQLYDPGRERGRAALAALADSRGLGASYRLVPSVNNELMPPFYNLADVVVSIPSSDGFPISVLEAQACGAPVVVARLPYCDDWFVQGDNGFVVAQDDRDGLVQAMIVLWRDEGLRRRFGAAGRRLVEERANFHSRMDELEHEYRQLLARKSGRSARRTDSKDG